jgi:hypothetical protein
MKKNFQFSSRSGIGIVETVIAAVIGGIIMMALIKMSLRSNIMAKATSNKIAFNDYMNLIQQSMANMAACDVILNGQSLPIGTNPLAVLGALPGDANPITAGTVIRAPDLSISNVTTVVSAGPNATTRRVNIDIAATQGPNATGAGFKSQSVNALVQVDATNTFLRCVPEDTNGDVDITSPTGGAVPFQLPAFCKVNMDDPNDTNSGCEIEALVKDSATGKTYARSGKLTISKQLRNGTETGKYLFHYYKESGSSDVDGVEPDGSSREAIANFSFDSYLWTAAKAVDAGKISARDAYANGKNEMSAVVWSKPGFKTRLRVKGR